MILPAGDYDLDEGATSRVSRNSKEEGKNGAELAASCNVQQEASPLQDPRKKRFTNSCVRRKSGCVCMPPEPQGVPCRFFIPSENCKAIEMHAQKESSSSTHCVLLVHYSTCSREDGDGRGMFGSLVKPARGRPAGTFLGRRDAAGKQIKTTSCTPPGCFAERAALRRALQ